MTCDAMRPLLDPYVDGELAPERAAAVADHLSSCAACSSEYEGVLRTVQTLREGLVRHHAPDVLRARIRGALREAAATSVPAARRDRWLPWRAVAAAVLIAAASSAVTLATSARRSADRGVADEVLTSHIRSLMPAHLVDVQSSDQHNVKPWFNGRLDFSPAVPRLEDAGFPLQGGRLDYLHGRPVAAVVYTRRQHIVNVFSWPADSGTDIPASLTTRHGYNLVHWRASGVEHWLASDLNAAELEQFARLLQGGGPSGARGSEGR
jgi:anti-sigma factor RsiW